MRKIEPKCGESKRIQISMRKYSSLSYDINVQRPYLISVSILPSSHPLSSPPINFSVTIELQQDQIRDAMDWIGAYNVNAIK